MNDTAAWTTEHLLIASALVNRYDIVNKNVYVWNKNKELMDTDNEITSLGFGRIGASFKEVVIKAVSGHSTDKNGNLLSSYQKALNTALNSDLDDGPYVGFDGDKVNSYCYRLVSSFSAAYTVLSRQFIYMNITSWNKGDADGSDNPDKRNLVNYGIYNKGGNTYYGTYMMQYRRLPAIK